MGIAPAAPAALGDDKIFLGGHIHNDGIGFRIPDHGAPGHLDDQGVATLAGHIPALAILACLGGIFALIAEVQQCGQIVIHTENDTAAVTTIAAIRAAGCHIFFPVEGNGAIAALTAADSNSNLIYKHFHNLNLL